VRILILGADGYLGWPTALHFSQRGDDVMACDNFAKRQWRAEVGAESVTPIRTLHERVRIWEELTGRCIRLAVGDITNWSFLSGLIRDWQPDTIVHYGEQHSAPYSMIDRDHAVFTQTNNVMGTLNVLWAMRDFAPAAHLVKLGTMGEYGTPNIDIEEGYLAVEHNGRQDVLPYPKQPGSFYHLSKVHDSHNMLFACRIWELRATDLNQGVVYGVRTDETALDERLCTSFSYDECWGTVLNRFCAQAVMGMPLTVYGAGGQTRGFLDIRDTVQCVDLAARHPAEAGELRVFNQFTEQFAVAQLADVVCRAAGELGIAVTIAHVENPRVEKDAHYYNARHTRLLDLGLQPHRLSETLVESIIKTLGRYRDRIDPGLIMPKTRWRPAAPSASSAS
jgi:UDP-sulfoquinovose synthase